MDVDLHIEGVSGKTTDAIRVRLRQVWELAARPGEWRITISPSETRGQWDVGMTTSSNRWFGSVDGTVDRLPELVDRKLREFLQLPPSAPDVSRPRKG
jgi:hypothetical protein